MHARTDRSHHAGARGHLSAYMTRVDRHASAFTWHRARSVNGVSAYNEFEYREDLTARVGTAPHSV